MAYMISFAMAYLHDDGAFLLFYPEGSNMRKDIFGYFKIYNFKIKDEWTIINCLHLVNLVIPNKNVSVPMFGKNWRLVNWCLWEDNRLDSKSIGKKLVIYIF